MTTSTIKTHITKQIVLDQGNYANSLTITNQGAVTGATFAVYAPDAFPGAVIQNAGLIHAGDIAVYLPGAGTITNTGSIYGGSVGVGLVGLGTLTNSGTISGGSEAAVGIGATYISALNAGNVQNTGLIHGTGIGLDALYANVTNSGSIYGGLNGAFLLRGSLNNSGTITSKTLGVALYGGSFTNSGSVGAQTVGLFDAADDFTNAGGGRISGDLGVALHPTTSAGLTFTNDGDVTGISAAVYLTASSLINFGSISGTEFGIYLQSGQIANHSTISGATGIYAAGGTITNSGVINGSTFAVYGNAAFTLDLAPGTAGLANAGINGAVEDTSGNGVLELGGSAPENISGIGTSVKGFSEIAFASPSTAGSTAWSVEGNVAGLASGQTITGFTLGDAITLAGFAASSDFLTPTGLVLNEAGTLATLGVTGNIFQQNISVSSAGGNTEIDFVPITTPIATINTEIGNLIFAGGSYVSSNLTITNTGTALNYISAASSDTINNEGLTNFILFSFNDTLNNSGTVAGYAGIYGGHDGIINNAGTIFGQGSHVYAVNMGVFGNTLTNTGEIISSGTAVMSGGGLINNSGSISGAVLISDTTLDNTGTITSAGTAINSGFYGRINNDGDVTGENVGILLSLNDYGSVFNTGTITGGMDGIKASGGTVINAGLISGSSYAIYNLGNDPPFNYTLQLTVDPGARFAGAVRDTSGKAQLTLAGSTASDLDMGNSFSGFSGISFATGSEWTLEGDAAELAAGQTISGFLTGNTIVLDSFAATYEVFLPGTGLILSNGHSTETLGIVGNYTYSDFRLVSGNDESVIIAGATSASQVATISTAFHHEISVGAGLYASSLTITNTGTIIPATREPAITDSPGLLKTSPDISNAGFIGFVDLSSGTLVNTGTVDAYQDVYIQTGMVNNSGLITNSGYTNASGIRMLSGTVINSGTINSNVSTSTIINTGWISNATGHYAAYISEGEISNAGMIFGGIYAEFFVHLTVEPGAVFTGPVNAGLYESQSSGITLSGSTSGTLDMGNSFIGFPLITFAPGAEWTLEGATNDLAAGQTITGLASGDTLILDSFAATADTFISGTGLILSNATASETLAISGALPAGSFSIADNPEGGTEITAPCFCPGTRIATPKGETPVEHLKIGDLVQTLHHGAQPVIWIGQRGYAGRFIARNPMALPIRIRRHALARNIPSRDLYVSPDHAICENGVLVPARCLVNGKTITQARRVKSVTYIHIELARHGVIFANNTPSESFLNAQNCRARFHNAREFAGPDTPQPACLPRIEHGFLLQRIQTHINARAGLAPPPLPHGPLRGHIEHATAEHISGWVQDSAAPETPIHLEIILNGQVIGHVLANAYRQDLQNAGLGSGRHAFRLDYQAPIPGGEGAKIRRAHDHATLPSIALPLPKPRRRQA